jgi:hypothetical protein
MEELFKELSKFARENRKALKSAEQWLNEFDGNIADVWEVAKNELPIDWKKIVFIAWFASDEKIYECKFIDEGFSVHQWCPKKKDGRNPQIDFLCDVILRVGESYSTENNPSLYLIRNALNEGKNRPEDEKGPVSKRAGLIYDKLKSLTPPKHGMTTNELLDWLSQERENIDEKTLRRHLNELKPYGLDNKPRIGYYLKQ